MSDSVPGVKHTPIRLQLTPSVACAVIASRDCESFTTGLGSCFTNGRDPLATQGVDLACAPCVAWMALRHRP